MRVLVSRTRVLRLMTVAMKWRHPARTDLLPASLFRQANALRELRHAVDYEYDRIESRHVEPFVATVEQFIDWADERTT